MQKTANPQLIVLPGFENRIVILSDGLDPLLSPAANAERLLRENRVAVINLDKELSDAGS